MPLESETFTLEEAVADLEDEKEELVDEMAQIHPDDRTDENSEYLKLGQQIGEIERYLGGLDWVREEFGGDVRFALSGLTTAETLEVGDRGADLRSETITPTKSTNNIETVFWVAKGLDEAPFLDETDYDSKCAAVRELPRQVTDWLESRINDLTTVGNRNSSDFEQLLQEKTEQYHQTSS